LDVKHSHLPLVSQAYPTTVSKPGLWSQSPSNSDAWSWREKLLDGGARTWISGSSCTKKFVASNLCK